jgi:DNA polymerase III epsilon subunit-like protein
MGLQYYTVDTETNGIRSGFHEINEISIIRHTDRVQLTLFIKTENPERSSFDALSITKKTLADLEKGISKEEAILKIDKFINEDGLTSAHRCFVGHNVQFDRKFVFAMYEAVGKVFGGELWLDTMALTRQFIKESGIAEEYKTKGLPKPKVNLHACLDLLQIKKLSEAHASKVDSRNTYLLWKNLVEEKKIDYLPFIKTATHVITTKSDEEQGLDPDLLD